jgi:hypothetical protein
MIRSWTDHEFTNLVTKCQFFRIIWWSSWWSDDQMIRSPIHYQITTRTLHRNRSIFLFFMNMVAKGTFTISGGEKRFNWKTVSWCAKHIHVWWAKKVFSLRYFTFYFTTSHTTLGLDFLLTPSCGLLPYTDRVKCVCPHTVPLVRSSPSFSS